MNWECIEVNIAKQTQIFNNLEAGAFSGFERNLAFIIGIDNYQNGISKLNTAVNDAKKLVEVLREKHQYQAWVCLNTARLTIFCDDSGDVETRKPKVSPKENFASLQGFGFIEFS